MRHRWDTPSDSATLTISRCQKCGIVRVYDFRAKKVLYYAANSWKKEQLAWMTANPIASGDLYSRAVRVPKCVGRSTP